MVIRPLAFEAVVMGKLEDGERRTMERRTQTKELLGVRVTGNRKIKMGKTKSGGLPNLSKTKQKWWGGYDKAVHRIVLFEDFPVDGKYLAHYMKILVDRFSFIATSNYALDEVFEGEDLKALKRRFHEVEIKDSSDVFLQTHIDLKILN